MIELGKKQTLVVVREKDFGIYLAEKQGDEASVLLPKKQVPAGTKIGDSIEVFIYKESDRDYSDAEAPGWRGWRTEGKGSRKNRRFSGFWSGEGSAASI